MSTYFEVVNVANGEVLSDLPSPLLIQQGGGEAFSPDGGTFWRLREDGDPEGTTYTRVRIRHLEDWTVDYHLAVDDEDGTHDEDSYWTVKAADSADAIERATKDIVAEARRFYGEDAVVLVSRLYARQGFRL